MGTTPHTIAIALFTGAASVRVRLVEGRVDCDRHHRSPGRPVLVPALSLSLGHPPRVHHPLTALALPRRVHQERKYGEEEERRKTTLRVPRDPRQPCTDQCTAAGIQRRLIIGVTFLVFLIGVPPRTGRLAAVVLLRVALLLTFSSSIVPFPFVRPSVCVCVRACCYTTGVFEGRARVASSPLSLCVWLLSRSVFPLLSLPCPSFFFGLFDFESLLRLHPPPHPRSVHPHS